MKFDVLVIVEWIEYDFNCIVFIVLIKYEDGEQVYILVLQCLVVGDKVIVGVKVDVKFGNVMFFLGMLIGMIVYNVELKFGKGGQIVCLVGIYVQFVGCDGGYVQICLFLGELCMVCQECMVIIGVVLNLDYLNQNLGKVGCNCYKGICLSVCGVVMNLIDYLYGGGEGCIFGGCYLVMFWGKGIKGNKICNNKLIDKYILWLCNVKKGC